VTWLYIFLHFLLALTLLLIFPFGSQATQFDNLIVFGDSLSDDGKIGRFTDGAIWVETLADYLDADLYNFAYGGATTGLDNPAADLLITGLQWQVYNYLAPTNDALYTVWAGANDFLQKRSFITAANNIGTALENLYDDGARDILVGNLPDIGSTPAFISTPAATVATYWTLGFNAQLEMVLSDFEESYDDAILYKLDAYGIFNNFVPGSDEWAKLFWFDGFHPSSDGHLLIANNAYSQVAPVPEPSTIVLMGLGLVGLAGFGRKKFRR
jgi:phospholipase/lecithinase/hemolysin